MKKYCLLATLLGLSLPALADINNKDVEEYAKINNVSIQEANRALNIEANKEALIDEIESQYNGRIAGIYIENSPTYKIVVKLKGNGNNEKKELAVKNVAGSVPVEFQYGAKETKEVAKGQIQKAQKLAQSYFSTVQLVSYNERTGNIDIEINEKSSPDILNKINELKASWKNPKIDLNVVLVNYTIQPMALAYGGTPVIDKSQVATTGMAYDCTTAFGVQDSSGKKVHEYGSPLP